MPNFRHLGREAEDRAAEYLLEQGFTIVTRRYKARRGEIDLVALDGDVLVFVEVKCRRGPSDSPEAAIDEAKVNRLAEAAAEYAARFDCERRAARFDLIAVTPDALRHYRDAFRPR